MKRLWIGVGLLILLLLLGILTTVFAARHQEQISQTLAEARNAAEVGQWEKAAGACFRAKALWESRHHLTASIADHEPMEEVESLFAQLEIYLKARDPVAFSACCSGLEVFVRAIGEAHSVNWWSLL